MNEPTTPALPDQQNNRGAFQILFAIAAAMALVHILTNSRYGFHRDELQFLSDSRHLDWGFVPYPPFTAFVERVSTELFGLSIVWLRMFSVVAQAIAIVMAGLMTRELGGGRLAQATVALVIALSPLPMFEGTEFQYSSFDYLWWVLVAYFTIRLLKSEDPRWWLAIGAAAGMGMMTKYTMAFLLCGVAGGLLLTPQRRYFLNAWFWGGAALGLAIFLPNLLWQVRHQFISLDFLHHIHVRDVRQGRADGFFKDQFLICVNVAATPLWIVGLIACLRDQRYRLLAWMYLIPLALFVIGKGRGYYLAPGYPMLVAMGSVARERWVASLSLAWRRTIRAIFFTALFAAGAYIGALILPLQAAGPLRDFALARNGDLREEFGWEEMVKTVAGIRDSLPPEQRQDVGVIVGNYGEQGAIEILGPQYHLPPPISMTNSAWLRGYPTPQPSTLIVLGYAAEDAEEAFTSCRLAGHNRNSQGIKNEESEYHQAIFVCGPPQKSWPEFWATNRRFG
jgi:hypothetical protein